MKIISLLFVGIFGGAASNFISMNTAIIMLVVSIILWILSSDLPAFILSQICTAFSSGALAGNLINWDKIYSFFL